MCIEFVVMWMYSESFMYLFDRGIFTSSYQASELYRKQFGQVSIYFPDQTFQKTRSFEPVRKIKTWYAILAEKGSKTRNVL